MYLKMSLQEMQLKMSVRNARSDVWTASKDVPVRNAFTDVFERSASKAVCEMIALKGVSVRNVYTDVIERITTKVVSVRNASKFCL
jgi:hypothetical protein